VEQNTTGRVVWVGFAALVIAMGIGRFAFTPLLPMMQADGLVDINQGGLLAAVHFLAYLLGAVFAARIPIGPKLLLRGSLIIIALSTIGMGARDSFPAALVFRALCGVCSAVILVLVGTYYVRHLTEAGAGDKQGWVFSGVGAGIAIVGLAALFLMLQQIGAANSWLIIGFLTLLAVIGVCLGTGSEIPANRPPRDAAKTSGGGIMWLLVIAYGVAGFGYVIPATYLPVMARQIVTAPEIFGLSWPVFGLAAFASTLLAARLQRFFSNRQIWAAAQFVMAVGVLLPILWPTITMIILSGVCVGGTFMIITMVGMKEMHRLAPASDVARHIAIMTTAFAAGQILGPLAGSLAHDFSQSFTPALLAAALALILTTLSLILSKTGVQSKAN
jgi:predicted MFS family arabinose efflux permease